MPDQKNKEPITLDHQKGTPIAGEISIDEKARKQVLKDKLIADIKAETDTNKKLENLEKWVHSSTITQEEADALQKEIEATALKDQIDKSNNEEKPNFFNRLWSAVLYDPLKIDAGSGWRTATWVGMVAAWSIAAIRWANRLYKWRKWPSEKEKQEAAEKEKNKTLRDKVWDTAKQMAKRWLIAWGIAGVGMYIMGLLTGGKWLGEIFADMMNTIMGEKKPWSTGDEKPEVAGDPEWAIKDNRSEFLKLPEADQKIYNEWGTNANTRGKNAWLSDNIFGGDMELSATVKDPDGTERTIDMTGLPASILNAKHNTIDQLLSERTIYREMMQSNDVVWFVWKLKWYLGDATGWIKDALQSVKNLFIPDDCFDAKGVIVEDKFIAYLKEHPDAEELLRNHIKKSLLTISYLNSRRREYAYNLIATKYTKEDPTFATLSDEDKNEKIIALFADEEYMKTIEPTLEAFDKLSLFSAIKLLKETWSLNGDVDQVTQAWLDEVDDEKNDFLEIDPEDGDTVNCFSEIKEKLNKGEKLSEEEKELLIDKSDELLAMVQDFGETDWIMAHFGPIGDLLGRDRWAAKADILESMGYNANVLNPLQTFITGFQKAVKEDTLTGENLNEFENATNDFFEYKKEIVLNTNEFADIKYNDDGTIELRFLKFTKVARATAKTVGWLVKDAVVDGWTEMATWLVMVRKGDVIQKLEWWRHVLKWMTVGSAWLIAWGWMAQKLTPILKNAGVLSVIPKLGEGALKLWKIGIKPATIILEQGLRRSGMMPKIPRLNAKYYQNFNRLRADRARGWGPTVDDVSEIALKNGLITVTNPNDISVVRKAFIQQCLIGKWMNTAELQRVDNLITQYPKSKSLQRALFSADKKRWQFRSKNIGIKINTQFMEVAEHITKPQFAPHLFNNTLTKEQLLTRIIKAGKSFSMADIPALSSHIHELQKAGKFDAIVLKNLLGNRKTLKWMKSLDLVAQFDALKLGKNFKWEVLSLAKNAIGEISIQAKNAGKSIAQLTRSLWKYSAKRPGAKQLLAKINSQPLLKSARDLDCFAFLGSAKRAESLSATTRLELAAIESSPEVILALSKAKTITEVKTILSINGVSSVDTLPEGMLKAFSQTKWWKKVLDMVHFAANYEKFSGLGKFLKSPGMKFLGRFLSRALIVAEAGMGIYSYIEWTSEANEVKQKNLGKGEMMQDQTNVNAALDGAMLWTWVVLLCIPWAWWVALAIGLWVIGAVSGVKELINANYEIAKTFKENKIDLMDKAQDAVIQVHQHIVGKQAYMYGMEWATDDGDRKKSVKTIYGDKPPEFVNAIKTSSDAVEVALLFEEYAKNPIAMIDRDMDNKPKKELIKMIMESEWISEIEANNRALDLINQSEQDVQTKVLTRLQYLKSKYGTETLDNNGGQANKWEKEEYINTRKLIPEESIRNNQWLRELQQIIKESSIYAYYNLKENSEEDNDVKQRFTDHTAIENWKKTAGETIKKSDPDYFTKIDTLYKDNKEALIQMWTMSQQYTLRNITMPIEEDDSEKDIEQKHYTMLQDYIQWKELTDNLVVANYPTMYGYKDIDKTDYNQAKNFLKKDWGYITSSVIPMEQFKKDPSIIQTYSNEDLESHLRISPFCMQNILYRYATEVLHHAVTNTMPELIKIFPENDHKWEYLKDKQWIYYDTSNQIWKARDSAHNFFSGYDIEFGNQDTPENIQKLLDYINSQTAYFLDLPNGEKYIATEMIVSLRNIIHEELRYFNNRKTIVEQAYDYIKSQTDGQDGVIELPLYMIHQLTRAWCPDVAGYAYRYDHGNIVLYGAGGASKSYSKIELLAWISERRQHLPPMVQVEDRSSDSNSHIAPWQWSDRFDGWK